MSLNRRSEGSKTDSVRFLEDEFIRAASASITALLGAEPEIKPVTPSDLQAFDFWLLLPFQPIANAPILIGSSRNALLALGREASGLSESTEATEAAALSAVVDLWSEIGAAVAASITARSKQELSAGPVQALAAKPSQVVLDHVVAFELELPNAQIVPVQLVIHPDLVKANLSPNSTSAAEPSQSMNTKNLDLLLDVEMPVSVSFGRAQLPLKDVIKLTTGSIVELSRSVSEPVDIIVNNCVIARGEVVVVEGNFGVRIKEISSKQERLKTLS